jgi:hypothetical protein
MLRLFRKRWFGMFFSQKLKKTSEASERRRLAAERAAAPSLARDTRALRDDGLSLR